MRMQKKEVVKEDGRYLVYYHFPDSATPEQTGTFEAIGASLQSERSGNAEARQEPGADGAPPMTAPSGSDKDERRV